MTGARGAPAPRRRTPPASFAAQYDADPDPWQFATSPYELGRYDATIAALPTPRYRRAFEPGCSIGVLTERLAARCQAVVAWDCAPAAAVQATARCAAWPGVSVSVATLPDAWPEGPFDLVVLSELGYYFDVLGLASLRDRARDALDPGGTLLAVHWTGHSVDHVLHGNDVHAVLGAGRGLEHVAGRDHPGFRLDVWRRA